MKSIATTVLSLSALFLFSGCLDGGEAKKEVKSYQYTTAEVYTQMCAKCHGKQGEGVAEKKGPALNDQELYELKLGIEDVKSGGLNQSSGTEHDIMEHNMKKIIEKGMDYDTDAMAEYIYNNFHK
jgi:cytochrome c553